MVPLVFFAASCFVGGKKIHVWKRQEATLTSLPTEARVCRRYRPQQSRNYPQLHVFIFYQILQFIAQEEMFHRPE